MNVVKRVKKHANRDIKVRINKMFAQTFIYAEVKCTDIMRNNCQNMLMKYKCEYSRSTICLLTYLLLFKALAGVRYACMGGVNLKHFIVYVRMWLQYNVCFPM